MARPAAPVTLPCASSAIALAPSSELFTSRAPMIAPCARAVTESAEEMGAATYVGKHQVELLHAGALAGQRQPAQRVVEKAVERLRGRHRLWAHVAQCVEAAARQGWYGAQGNRQRKHSQCRHCAQRLQTNPLLACSDLRVPRANAAARCRTARSGVATNCATPVKTVICACAAQTGAARWRRVAYVRLVDQHVRHLSGTVRQSREDWGLPRTACSCSRVLVCQLNQMSSMLPNSSTKLSVISH